MGRLLDFIRIRAMAATDPDGPCLVWPFAIGPNGYGRVEIAGKSRPVHQVVLEESGVPKPFATAEVRHLCGTRPCCARGHLKWGTRAENQQDRFRRHGATMHGEANPRARLTADRVVEIRGRLGDGELVGRLAREYGVAQSTISMVKSRRTWMAD